MSRLMTKQFGVRRSCGAAAMLVMLIAMTMIASVSAAQEEPAQPPAGGDAEKPMTNEKDAEPVYVRMTTSKGDVYLELNTAKAPRSVENFMQYVADEFYDGTIFHRVIERFMIQGGGFTKDLTKKPTRDGIENEWQNGLKNDRGTISMARIGGQPDSATSQFFINVEDNPGLDQPQRDGAGYAVFGKVVAGMDVVDAIRTTPVQVSPLNRREISYPTETIMIESVRKIDEADAMKAIDAEKNAGESAPAQPESGSE